MMTQNQLNNNLSAGRTNNHSAGRIDHHFAELLQALEIDGKIWLVGRGVNHLKHREEGCYKHEMAPTSQ